MVRLSDDEHDRFSAAADSAGATLAGYLRTAGHQTMKAEATHTASFWQCVGADPPSEFGVSAEHLSHLESLRNRVIHLQRTVLTIVDALTDPNHKLNYQIDTAEAFNDANAEVDETLTDYRRMLSLVLEPEHPTLKSLRCAHEDADQRATPARLVADDLVCTARDARCEWAAALRAAAGDSGYTPTPPDESGGDARPET